MRFSDQTLVKKLAIVVVFKLVILVALWWGFVRDARVTVDGNRVAAQFLQPAPQKAEGTKQ